MKAVFYTLFLLLLFSACARPHQLIEQGQIDQALFLSIKKLEKGKINFDHVLAMEKAFRILTETDRHTIASWKAKGRSDVWLEIFKQAEAIIERQERVEKIKNRLTQKGITPVINFYPAVELREEAREKSALFFYAEAQSFLIPARKGNRVAARKAYQHFQQCLAYISDFKDAQQLSTEMYETGITHFWINPTIGPVDQQFSIELFKETFGKLSFPITNGWQVFHKERSDSVKLHYQLNMFFDELYTSPDCEFRSCCSQTKEIQTGTRIEKEWSEKDSAYIEIKKPVFKKVSVTVTTFNQSKNANLKLYFRLLRLPSYEEVDFYFLRGQRKWENKYSTISGDERALDFSCKAENGNFCYFPSNDNLLLQAACSLQGDFKNIFKKEIPEL